MIEVPHERFALWAAAYDEVLRFSKFYNPRPGTVFAGPRAKAYVDYIGEMRRYLAEEENG